jgi:hypothetical protein
MNLITPDKLDQLYKDLTAPFNPEAVQRADTKATKGYDMTGIGYQYIVNRLNEVLGLSHWHYQIDDVRVVESSVGDVKSYEVAVTLVLWVGNWVEGRFEPVAKRGPMPGSSRSTSLGDAYKGAVTNALKKCAALLGVGKEAYEGTLDDDYKAAEKDLPIVKTRP